MASAALAESGGSLAEVSAPSRGGRPLLDLIAEAFRSARREPAELRAVIAVSGPGSFTGVRITLATAMGLAAGGGDGAPRLLTISSLAALALQAPRTARSLLTLVDAMRGERFVQRFARDADGLRAVGDPFREAAEAVRFEGVDAIVAFPGGAPDSGSAVAAFTPASPLAAAVAVAASSTPVTPLLRHDFAPLYLRSPAVTLASRRTT